ncbi:tetratricopeptide repeat protein [Jannaschia sp. Os4]|uniref:tetratricopeptide repeat protein n=1 Tax=Jannaschia sp. Os4 TaxID=2807617 RepID=UPI00193952CE|nr:tetratricopeptide repeat protein [Jannaschia sp. Os4]MBM2575139.1 tetratricopeptide repeat protein [Jannaschia sp. Os4]
MRRTPMKVALLVCAAALLAACKSPEEKADVFFVSGVEFLAAGDLPRAEIELKNALRWNESHRDARRAMADLHVAAGDLSQAYAVMTDYIERWPTAADIRHRLGVLALRAGDWGELERHAEAMLKSSPQAPEAEAMEIVLRYRQARRSGDREARAAAAAEARRASEVDPEDGLMLRVVLDDIVTGPNPSSALPILDAALARDPQDRKLQMMRIGLLTRQGDARGAGARLMQMADLFPDDENVRGLVVAWLLQQGDVDGAETYLRSLAAARPGDPKGHLDVVRLLRGTQGAAAAKAELAALVAAAPEADRPIYEAHDALIDFEDGDRDAGLAKVRAVAASMPDGDRRARVRVLLAGMLEETGDLGAAKAEIDAVLASHPAQVEALKMRGRWLMQEDRASEAILVLRTASEHDPRDPGIFVLLAGAHFLSGNPDLAGERLADAVDASGYAPAESLRYVRYLRRTNRPDVAAHVLLSARARSPGSLEVATATADLFLRRGDWAAAAGVARDLSAMGTAESAEAALAIQTSILAAQDRHAEGVALLNDLALRHGDDELRPTLAMATALVRVGRLDRARQYVDTALLETPHDRDLRLVSGSLHAQAGELAAAEADYRGLVDTDPSDENAVRLLTALLRAVGREEEAAEILARGLAAAPGSRMLRMDEASRLEAIGQIDDAIALTQALHEEDRSDSVATNNLASLLATWRTDAASLDRAAALAARLAGLDAPALRHTRGWVAYRQGALDAALPDLRAAAEALPGDPIVQFHLGMAYASWGRTEEAGRRFAAAEARATEAETVLMERVLQEAQDRWAAEADAGVARP